MEKFGMGAPVRRVEDTAFLTGHGRYVSDHAPAGMLHAFVLRSPMAHADFRFIDLETARTLAGVHLVLTHAEVEEIGPLPSRARPPLGEGEPLFVPEHPVLARGRVRHVGEPVAFIVADTPDIARSAAELIEIEWSVRAAVVETARALDAEAPSVWPEHGGNLAYVLHQGDREAAERAFRQAARIAEIELINNRVVANYLEPRGVVGEYDPESGRVTVTVCSQGVHSIRDILSEMLRMPAERLRVITPDVGGGFGTKYFVYAEYPLVIHAARLLARPVKWMGERGEHFLGDTQGRDHFTRAALALDAEGRFLALRVDLTANMGAYPGQIGLFVPTLGLATASGLYDIPVIDYTIRGVYTNTVPVDAYRGAGRPEAAYLIERLVDEAARVTGLSAQEVRRRNFIAPDALPYRTATGRVIDSGDFAAHLDGALALADRDGFPERERKSAAVGRFRGIGIASYVEAAAFASSETAEVKLERDGSFTILIGTQSNGQGHATAYAQMAAAHFGVPVERVRLVQGDTDLIGSGGGTGGSRSIPIGATAVERASVELRRILIAEAADELEAAPGDIELAEGMARVAGTDRSVSLAQLATRCDDMTRLAVRHTFEQTAATYPNGTHVAEVEIDPETGLVEVVAYSVVDDFGVTLNPLLLAGQVHGGVAQGLGQALSECTVYDEEGQLLTASLMDYALPRALDIPDIAFATRNVPCTTNPLGIKGAGEAGTVGAAPAVMNAVLDALRRGAGVTHFDMPATPWRVWQAIRDARQRG